MAEMAGKNIDGFYIGESFINTGGSDQPLEEALNGSHKNDCSSLRRRRFFAWRR